MPSYNLLLLLSLTTCEAFLVRTGSRISLPKVFQAQQQYRLSATGWDDSELGEELSSKRGTKQKSSVVIPPSPEAPPSSIVFVGNLPLDYSKEQLAEFAESVGAGVGQGLLAARIQFDMKRNSSRGFGFLDYSVRENAEVAAAKLGGLEIGGRKLKIDIDGGTGINRGRRLDLFKATNREFSVFVGNLDYSLREKDVEDIFRKEMSMGEGEGEGGEEEGEETTSSSSSPIKCRLLYQDGRSKGMGHIAFTNAEAVKEAMFLNGLEVMGRPLIVERARGIGADKEEAGAGRGSANPQPSRPTTPSIFVGNLHFEVTAEEMVDMCNDILGPGVVKKVRLSVDRESGQFRGFGHLDFSEIEDAERALKELGDVELMGRRLRVDRAAGPGTGRGGGGGGGGGGGAWVNRVDRGDRGDRGDARRRKK